MCTAPCCNVDLQNFLRAETLRPPGATLHGEGRRVVVSVAGGSPVARWVVSVLAIFLPPTVTGSCFLSSRNLADGSLCEKHAPLGSRSASCPFFCRPPRSRVAAQCRSLRGDPTHIFHGRGAAVLPGPSVVPRARWALGKFTEKHAHGIVRNRTTAAARARTVMQAGVLFCHSGRVRAAGLFGHSARGRGAALSRASCCQSVGTARDRSRDRIRVCRDR